MIKDTRALAPAEPIPLTTRPRTTWNSDFETPLRKRLDEEFKDRAPCTITEGLPDETFGLVSKHTTGCLVEYSPTRCKEKIRNNQGFFPPIDVADFAILHKKNVSSYMIPEGFYDSHNRLNSTHSQRIANNQPA